VRLLVVTFVAVLLLCGPSFALEVAEVPLDELQGAIADGVKAILAAQREDGVFQLSEKHVKEYPLGSTALAVMALQEAKPHLKGELQARAAEAIRRGIAVIAQNPLEQKTYSAGFIICALFNENPQMYRKLIDLYAQMLSTGQRVGTDNQGLWGYELLPPPGVDGPRHGESWGDRSNTQIALLGMYFATRAGFQGPVDVWVRAYEQYVKSQFADGGWGYCHRLRPSPYANMTVASTISLALCEEVLFAPRHKQCVPPKRNKSVEAGLDWITKHWAECSSGADTYGMYALERLGMLMGRSNIGGHDWFNDAAREIVKKGNWESMFGTRAVSACFAVLFLSRGLEPIAFNKLERKGTDDWNNDPYDIKHVTEFISDRYQTPVQWRIVTLEAPLELLLRTPILCISGHDRIKFTDAEKVKLADYVMKGGTILGSDCCGAKEFDKSFRAEMEKLFGAKFRSLGGTNVIYERMKVQGVEVKPEILVLPLDNQQGRPAVIYLPNDLCCRWTVGGAGGREALTVGVGIYLWVTTECRRQFEATNPGKTAPGPEVPPPVLPPDVPPPPPPDGMEPPPPPPPPPHK
jgi:hypothetical protein